MVSKLKLILPMLGDFANGIFAVSFAGWLYGVELVWWQIIIAILISVLPDVDAIPELLVSGQVGKPIENSTLATNHRSYLHFPTVVLLIGLVIFSVSQFWGITFLVAVALHITRDVIGTGWGVKLLWPVNDVHYKFFAHGNDTLQVTHALTDEQLVIESTEHGNPNWLEETYLRITWISGIEYTLFGASVLLVYLHLVY